MIIRPVPFVLVFLALVLAACGEESASSLSGDLRYVRSGGIAGDHVELLVRPSGEATLKSRRGGEREFTLTEAELDALAADAANLPSASGGEKPAVPDAFVYTITYEGRTGRTDDPDLGGSGLAPVVRRLEKIIEAHR